VRGKIRGVEKRFLAVFQRIMVTMVLAASLVPKHSFATVFPWVEQVAGSRSVRFYTLHDSPTDMALRIELIRGAKKSIQIATYEQANDEMLGIPMLQALRDAANRGVRIQLVTSKWPATVKDFDGLVARMISDPDLLWPGKVILFGGFELSQKGWNISDSMHEKIFLVDDEVAILGGRNHAGNYLKWLDFAVLIQENGTKKTLLTQIKRTFEDLWFDAGAISPPEEVSDVTPSELPDLSYRREVSLTSTQHLELQNIHHWLSDPNFNPPGLAFHPHKTRVVAHRFLHLLATGQYLGKDRLQIPDDIVATVSPLMEKAKQIRMSSLFILFHPQMKTALKTALENGAFAEIHFNGPESSTEMVPLALSYKDSLPDLIELMRLKQKDGSPVNLKVHVMKPTDYKYLHRKIMILDNHVFFGSHNFNLPSTLANSEVCIQVDDADFAQALTMRYDTDFSYSGRPLTLLEAVADFDNSTVGRWLAEFVHQFF